MTSWKSAAVLAVTAALTIAGIQVAVASAQATSTTSTPTSSTPTPPPAEPSRPVPFQQVVGATSLNLSSEGCAEIQVPAGQQLSIQNVSFEVSGQVQPQVYLRTTARRGNFGSNYLRGTVIDLKSAGPLHWTGEQATLLHSAAVNPGGQTFSLSACVGSNDSNSAHLSGLVIGYLEPLT